MQIIINHNNILIFASYLFVWVIYVVEDFQSHVPNYISKGKF